MKSFIQCVIALLLTLTLCACPQKSRSTIGIILPMEHQALEQIVAGFTDKLNKLYPNNSLQIKIMNAQGDLNAQRAIIEDMRDNDYALIVPIATDVTQMTLAIIHDQPIVSLASDFTEHDRQKLHPCNITAVQDEIPPERLVAFIHAVYPHLTRLILVHSTSEKISTDVKEAIEAGKQHDIQIRTVEAATLPALVKELKLLPVETQGILVLKDNLIVSGIADLVSTANAMRIPLFTSDQSSVEAGAGFSLGVHERAIGEEGAKLAAAVLSGKKSICKLPIVEMTKLTVFVNKAALEKQGQDFKEIADTAKSKGYKIELVG